MQNVILIIVLKIFVNYFNLFLDKKWCLSTHGEHIFPSQNDFPLKKICEPLKSDGDLMKNNMKMNYGNWL